MAKSKAWRAIVTGGRFIWWTAVVFIPLAAVWASSSLAAYLDGPRWATIAVGALFFPVLPIVWEWRASARRARRAEAKGVEPGARWLGGLDRIVLRTLLLNASFLIVLLGLAPQRAFEALATRGDWPLDGHHGEAAVQGRAALFACAQGLEWLYLATSENPYEKFAPDEKLPVPKPNPRPDDIDPPTPGAKGKPEPPKQGPPPVSGPGVLDDQGRVRWPMAQSLHPVVASMPPSAEASIESVAAHIAREVSDPYERVKALHDWVADRIEYDFAALDAGRYPDQDAESVFRTRLGVCAGYSLLLKRLGELTGDPIVYVVGDSRDEEGGIPSTGHAWNAVQIEGAWYLIDVTWNAGYRGPSGSFKKRYATSYFLTPPRLFAISHIPDDPAWQLLAEPIDRGEFIRQPQLHPRFFASGLELVSPTRSQTSTGGPVIEIELRPKRRAQIAAHLRRPGQTSGGARCDIDENKITTVTCRAPGRGKYKVELFATNDQSATTFPRVATLHFVVP